MFNLAGKKEEVQKAIAESRAGEVTHRKAIKKLAQDALSKLPTGALCFVRGDYDVRGAVYVLDVGKSGEPATSYVIPYPVPEAKKEDAPQKPADEE